MSDPIREHNIGQYLTAFADGELDGAQILTVLDYLADHPDGLELMRIQQRIRVAAARAVRTQTPPVPDALRRRIEELATVTTPASRPDAREQSWAGLRWHLPAVAALFLVTGLLVGRWAFAPKGDPRVVHVPNELAPVVPVHLVSQASRVHADCSRLAEGLHAATYPKEMGELSAAVRADLGGDDPYPDFTGIGYEYVGAGPCGDPLRNTIHLLYYSTRPGPRSAISVFVQPHAGQFTLEPGKLYQVSDGRSPFPMFAWRTTKVVYFLLADNADLAEAGRRSMSGAPGPPAVRQ